MVFSKKTKKNGFTLIEILVAISIMLIMLAITIDMTKSLNDSVNLENAGKNVDLKIRTAKSRSIGALGDSNYGVHFETSRVVVFAGSTFDDSDPENEVFTLPDKIEIDVASIDFGGGNDLVFERLTGNTSDYGSVSLRVINDVSKTRTIFINSNGQSSFSAFQTSAGPTLANARHIHFDLGWNIMNATQLKLVWVDGLDTPIGVATVVDTTDYFNADKSKFDWEGTTNINGTDQNIQIHSWLDGSGYTVLCVTRSQTETEKLHVYFNDGIEKHIVTYDRNGASVDVTPDIFYGGTMTIQ